MEWAGLRSTLKFISLHGQGPSTRAGCSAKMWHLFMTEVVTSIPLGYLSRALQTCLRQGRQGSQIIDRGTKQESHSCTFSLSGSIFSFTKVTTSISTNNGWSEETKLTSCCNFTEQRLIPRTTPLLFPAVLESPDNFAIHKL